MMDASCVMSLQLMWKPFHIPIPKKRVHSSETLFNDFSETPEPPANSNQASESMSPAGVFKSKSLADIDTMAELNPGNSKCQPENMQEP